MILSWQCIIVIILMFSQAKHQEVADLTDWRVIEVIAEQHPYLIALLDKNLNVICTGTIINDDLVITSGRCVSNKPHSVAVGVAVIDNHKNIINQNSLKEIAMAITHEEYMLEVIQSKSDKEPSLTSLTSNIGLVFTREFILEVFHNNARIGNYYASELLDKQLTVIGYGRSEDTERMTLQKQWYHQTPCLNPKWYYCVCGLEYSTVYPTYDVNFGEGAPVVYGSEVVAVTALPCGMLSSPDTRIKYNVFTVIGPYLTWISKQKADADKQKADTNKQNILMRADTKRTNNGLNNEKNYSLRFIYIFLLVNKLLA